VIAPAVIVAAMLVQAPQPRPVFQVGPGTVVDGANAIAAQAGVDVVVPEPLRTRRTPGVSGRMTTEDAFARLLRPAGARAIRSGPGVYRIEALPSTRSAPPTPPPTAVLEDVMVTASVRRGGLAEATGQVLVSPSGLRRAEGLASSETVADLSASVDSTRQGQGRNKLFVRGVADSAFNGPLQSTIGQYLGDLRLNYGSPDPDLALVDMDRLEVFEGPQGARFGAGSIGGVVRLHPTSPDLGQITSRVLVGLSATSGGAPGGDATLVANRPLGGDAALRLVAYARRDGGFLDNPVRATDNADHIDTVGGRAALRFVRAGWTVDLLGVAQSISSDDAQTVRAQDRRMVKTRAVAEPYRSSLWLGGITASRDLGDLRLTSATSVSYQDLHERFDATGLGDASPSVVDRDQSVWALSSEFRAETRAAGFWSWTGGGALALGETTAKRRGLDLSPDPTPVYGSDLGRSFAEAAVFGEVVARPSPDLRLAFGGRLAAVRIVYDATLIGPNAVRGRPDDDGVSLDVTPTISARWTTPFDWSVFARFDRAVRPGGVTEGDAGVQTYAADRVRLIEAGLRTPDAAQITAEVSIGRLDWRDIQADVATQGGDLVTGNIGDGRIRFVSARAAWAPSPRLEIRGGLFVNDSLVRIDRPSIIGVTRAEIPNVAPIGAQLSVDYDAGPVAGLPLSLGADLRYIGESRLGLGPGLDAAQGGYIRTELTARLGDERRALSLRVSNPLDAAAVRYGIGSPYQLYDPQAVPLRPLTVRLGFETAF
jgi:iron complex outermembrane receptor protein